MILEKSVTIDIPAYSTCFLAVRQDNYSAMTLPLSRQGPGSYFLRKDMQSVHWSMEGFASWVPTRIRSREQ